jgi:hypothetical protein
MGKVNPKQAISKSLITTSIKNLSLAPLMSVFSMSQAISRLDQGSKKIRKDRKLAHQQKVVLHQKLREKNYKETLQL